jgi:hypothetical protein
VCGTPFIVSQGAPREKKTCSYACSNTLFRSGVNNGNRKEPGTHTSRERLYRDPCFTRYEEKCVICDWDISVDVHHIDGNHDNNDIDNLIPLCANHHRMAHMSKYKDEIKQKIDLVKHEK